ncbi:DEKNAAC103602 [Brettanomyces naardenensis]|uniref:DEKNAAC103602 n=1 Tax=Brettanomyces naardenensis TaxID=13370 RepID=A0A448YNM2_BRENA|nr:DEKNAAC103602 [Brettanomyces naardenensis]
MSGMDEVDSILLRIKHDSDYLSVNYGLHYYCIFHDSNYVFKREFMSTEGNEKEREETSIPSRPIKMMVINTNIEHEVNNYLFNCFEELQQIPCKLLAKQWIKLIEPRKQSTHPYNKGESTRPSWWPDDARHKEPDHLKKGERISLLINILKQFKEKEEELVNCAELVGEVKVDGTEIKRIGPMTVRKLRLLRDMFEVVNTNGSSFEVIKPGKKYSSKMYEKNRKRRAEEILKVQTQSQTNIIPLAAPIRESSDASKFTFTTPTKRQLPSFLAQNMMSSPLPPPTYDRRDRQMDASFMNESSFGSPLSLSRGTNAHDFPLNVMSSSAFNSLSNTQSLAKGKSGFESDDTIPMSASDADER